MRGGEPLRILQLSDFYPPVSGGLERVVADLSAALARRGAEVVVATLTPDPVPVGDVTVRTVQGLGSRVPGAYEDPARPFHPTFPDPRVARQLAVIAGQFRPHVVHAHSWLINSWLAVRGRSPRTATVAYAHDYGLFCARKTNQREPVGPGCNEPGPVACIRCATGRYGPVIGPALAAGSLAMRRLARRTDALAAVSTAVSATLATVLDVRPPVVIPPAVDLTGAASDPGPGAGSGAAPARPAFLPQGPYVLYVGQLSPHKGVDVLLEAVRAAPGLRLVMLGLPKPGWSPPDDPRVSVVLDVPHADVMAAWRYATVGVVPSLWADPMPLVGLEAMSQGCPLVVSAVGGLTDAVADGVTGRVVPAGDAVALGRALADIVDDPALRRRMADAALARSARFGIDHVVERWTDLYGQLVDERSGTVPQWT